MTCGTHTTANVTAAAFGFNPLLSGSFLKRHDSCECTICSLFRKKSPLQCPAGRARGTDTQIVILTLALSFFSFLFFFFGFNLASWPTALWVRWTRRSWCPFVLYFGDHGSLLPYFVTFQTSPISFIFQTQGYCQYAQLLPCVCMCVYVCVCACACVCVYIYKKRE